jgi:hypothetical protein
VAALREVDGMPRMRNDRGSASFAALGVGAERDIRIIEAIG